MAEESPTATSKLSKFDSEKEIILTKAKCILEKCTSLIHAISNLQKILTQKVQKFENKAKVILKNLECKLESYIISENKSLVE
ncbi:hypothetical protein FGO68_gene13601 [Halteria grandinella]|uniref:Uncharacterized protein n=1 Tax=Halteria grandinella TaxID=5974 RepID=A0A8J8T8U8_HALGN|nr:hypothetical protein FGO68_gene13601 [Halteria grandinella]